ncbi:hypothetical protein E2C01_080194 [Portunus trituberculatus]
MHYR